MSEKPTTVEGYLAALDPQARDHAEQLRAMILAAAPDATETIRYGMPAFQAGGATFLYLGAWKRHVGLYPIYRGPLEFEAALAPFRSGKDTVRFELGAALPEALVNSIVKAQRERT